MEIDPQRLLLLVKQKLPAFDAPVVFFWYAMAKSRGQYATELKASLDAFSAVVYELRSPDWFTSPNATQSDIARVIVDCRVDIEKLGSCFKQLAVIVLSKSEFSLPMVASPATLPNWYPALGGRYVNVPIVDLCWKSDGNLKSPEVDVNQLSALLYDFNQITLKLLELELRRNPKSGDAFISYVNQFSDVQKSGKRIAMHEFLSLANDTQSRLARIGYRPGAKNVDSIVSVVMRFVSASSPDEIHKKAKAFADALGIADIDLTDELLRNFIVVLFRPTNRIDNMTAETMREVCLSVYLASQLTTASAHSDSYGKFPLQLLANVSKHLVESLKSIVDGLLIVYEKRVGGIV
jgi:hypothetical protein